MTIKWRESIAFAYHLFLVLAGVSWLRGAYAADIQTTNTHLISLGYTVGIMLIVFGVVGWVKDEFRRNGQ